MPTIHERLESLGIQLPSVAGPFGAYVPVKRVGNLLYISGQLPMKDGKPLAIGQVPSRAPIEHAKAAARQCIINALGAVAAVDGLLDEVIGVIRVGVFVNSDATFTQQPQV